MSRHPKICIARSVSRKDMLIGIVGLMTSCMKGQGIYTKFKAKYRQKEALCSITLVGEETSTLVVDSKEEEEEEEVWVLVEDR
jgi:hypothetical protein